MRKGLASVAWLAERLGQPNLRVVDATWFLPSSPFASPVAAAWGATGASTPYQLWPALHCRLPLPLPTPYLNDPMLLLPSVSASLPLSGDAAIHIAFG